MSDVKNRVKRHTVSSCKHPPIDAHAKYIACVLYQLRCGGGGGPCYKPEVDVCCEDGTVSKTTCPTVSDETSMYIENIFLDERTGFFVFGCFPRCTTRCLNAHHLFCFFMCFIRSLHRPLPHPNPHPHRSPLRPNPHPRRPHPRRPR